MTDALTEYLRAEAPAAGARQLRAPGRRVRRRSSPTCCAPARTCRCWRPAASRWPSPAKSTWRVPPLELPDLQQPLARRDKITRTAAVQPVRRTRPRGQPRAGADRRTTRRPSRASAIGVDGIPLALELAAARTRVLTVEQLAERLEHDAGLLGGHQPRRTAAAPDDARHDRLEPRPARRAGADRCCGGCRSSPAAGRWHWPRTCAPARASNGERPGPARAAGRQVDGAGRRARAPWRAIACWSRSASTRRSDSKRPAKRRRTAARHAATLLELVFTQQAGAPGPDEIASLDGVGARARQPARRAALGAEPRTRAWTRCAARRRCSASGSAAATSRRAAPGSNALWRSVPAASGRRSAAGRSTRWRSCTGEVVTADRARPVAEQALVSRARCTERRATWRRRCSTWA